ncbi:DUF349 domain-containing protein [Pleionea sp. CnH1-48]|uniref:DUF349 domain-containing protein n=1 Tax=Pleionea sp. CnH1-48 TaxID=2954494 RepID=UPI002097D1D7|nr:DUF349 domain-containing protein [Pleionea sp. CnH1-48]MCO7223119.1 DUF349 domain-containing protein [Pleionea sp. CnH1-48]
MLKNLFRPKWQHSNPTVRIQALETLDEAQDKDRAILLSVALEDKDPQVQLAAYKRINSLDALKEIWKKSQNESIKMQVLEQLFQRLPDSERSVLVSQLVKSVEQDADQHKLVDFLIEHPVMEVAEVLLPKITEMDALTTVVQKVRKSEIQLQALAAIDDEAALKLLTKTVNQKSVLQVIRNRLKSAREEQQKNDEAQQKALHVCEAMEKLAAAEFDSQYQSRQKGLEVQWQALDETTQAPFLERYQNALKTSNDSIEAHQTEQEKLQGLLKTQGEARRLIQTITDWVEELKHNPVKDETDFGRCYHLFSSQWDELNTQNDLPSLIAEQFVVLMERLSRMEKSLLAIEQGAVSSEHLSNWKKQIERTPHSELNDIKAQVKDAVKTVNWPQEFAKPLWVLHAAELISEIDQRFKKEQQKARKKREYLEKKTRHLKGHINQRNLVAANKMMNYLRNELDELEGKDKNYIESLLNKAEESLAELRDWHNFATQPKKDELCLAMEALIESKMEPLALAERIQQLRDEWRGLQSSNADTDNEQWERFKAASDKAFEPCLAFYRQRDEVRATNLSLRHKMCDDLEALVRNMDWDNADWKNIAQIEKTAKKEWGDLKPVPQNEHKSSQQRFNSVIKTLRQKLDQERDANLTLRKELVEKASKLPALEDNRKAIEQAQALQSEWSSLGMTYFKAHKEQWELFKASIDQVYDKRNSERKAFKQGLTDNADALKQVVASIDKLAGLEDSELAKSYKDFESLQSEVDLSKALPRNEEKKLRQTYERSCQKYLERFQGIEGRKQNAQRTVVFAAEQLCIDAETAFEKGELKLDDVKQQLTELDALPDHLQKVFGRRLEALEQLTEALLTQTHQQNFERLSTLAIEAEVATHVETPEAWKPQRMAYQLEHLQQGGLQASAKPQDILSKVEQQWFEVGFVKTADRLQMQERIAQCRNALYS